MKTLKDIFIGAILLVMSVLMLIFAVLAWVAKHLYAGLVFITLKFVDDALYLVNKHYLGNVDENPYVKLLK